MSRWRRTVQVARFVGGVYLQRGAISYAAWRGDLFSQLNRPGRTGDPYAIYAEMRRRGPLLRTRLGNFSTTSHRLCNEVLRSRAFGVTPEDGSRDLAHQEGMDLSLLQINPPDHTRIRRLAAPAFTPRRMAGYRPIVDQAIHRLLDQAEQSDEFDLMEAFAAPLPIAVMTHLLGLPDDAERFRRLGSTLARALDGIWSLRQARVLAAAQSELVALFDDLLTRRAAQTEPADDLVAVLLQQEGRRITSAELGPLVRLILVAGFETTVNAIGNGMRWLLADRSQWHALVEDPSRADAAAEEVLRFDPPVQQTARVALVAAEVGGITIRPGQWVIPLLAAANRDPDVYPDPDRFDITRTGQPEHLAFSGGIHYCLGSPLARMELSSALRVLAERLPTIERAGEVEMRPGSTLRGPQRFPVRVR